MLVEEKDVSLEDLERMIANTQEQLSYLKDLYEKRKKSFIKEVKKFYETSGYELLGYRERRVFEFSLSGGMYTVETLGGGIYRISSPGGSFEFAWDCPFLKRGTVVG